MRKRGRAMSDDRVVCPACGEPYRGVELARLRARVEKLEKALKKIAYGRDVSSCWNCEERHGDGPEHYIRCGKRIARKALSPEDKK